MHKKYYLLKLITFCSAVHLSGTSGLNKERDKQVNQRSWRVQQGHNSSSSLTVSTSLDPPSHVAHTWS